MKLYKKKPVIISAIEYKSNNISEIAKFMKINLWEKEEMQEGKWMKSFEIATLEGAMIATEGDYIIKGVEGEFYPCKPDIFHKTYEEVKEY